MASLLTSVLLSLCLFSSPIFSNANAKPKLGFTADLIHRDSPKSPFYNPAETPSQRMRNAIHRSFNRAFHFSNLSEKGASLNALQTDITKYFGIYLMNVSLGTPPVPIMAAADTGSDLIWTQCKPCDDCYTQVDPLFDPKASSTYKDVSCPSSQCRALKDDASCSKKDNTCSYSMNYGDNSYSRGNVAVDTLTLGSTDNRPVQVKNIIIGCGHENAVTFRNKSSGIVGLGGGAVSLIKQLGDSIEGKFSYCLVPENDQTSKISFGTNAVVSGPGTVSTPLVVKSPETFYFITLKSITVGSKNMPTPGSDIKGNMVIDSGTTLTLLPGKYYFQIESAVASLIDAERSKDERIGSSLCYNATADLKFPVITMHFDGADVKLDSYNSFF
ncbi:putative nepenthesin [Arabidopsis thaliana]|uniref:Peptidase A1 domain-containing protein n=2 Tax=Arabidopsis TaxID=3701 RepID=A0A178UHD5_ARATH|nr:Peptidase family A1 domain [Arabidopsis thaliana x Arabidopsis arenosa]OAO93069.1 hypothetical protein AXX17_AT5G32030 [Arabidopsis thaliana]CAA0405492.1 unnamed protein product [Arabidopsis thaliana]